jgi:ATP-dependent DNA helicase RecG
VLEFLSTLYGEIVRTGIEDAHAERVVAYPSKALREAIVNAAYHRGYEGTSLAIRIALYPDRVEVTSYPGPVPGLEAEHLLAGAHPPQVPARNPLVGEMLKALRHTISRYALPGRGSRSPRYARLFKIRKRRSRMP